MLVWEVARCAAYVERGVDIRIRDHHIHTHVCVEQIVAVEHPDAGIISVKGDVVGSIGQHTDRIKVDRATG